VELIADLSRDTIVVLEFLATMAFALSGVIGALRKRMDIVGCRRPMRSDSASSAPPARIFLT
jgi:hypothetical protein